MKSFWLDTSRDVGFRRLATWGFWRTMIIYFCVFSVVGHLVEYPYCWIGMTYFDSVDPANEVLTNPLKPFFVYGIGIVLCCILLEPLRKELLVRVPNPLAAFLLFYAITVLIAMDFELIQGHLQNQPVNGEYPLWDVHDLPGNIMGQAWIVNDLLLGALITGVVWVLLPPCNWLAANIGERTANRACAIIAVATLLLTIITYS